MAKFDMGAFLKKRIGKHDVYHPRKFSIAVGEVEISDIIMSPDNQFVIVEIKYWM
jgi:hypothetical protein